jgi:hypothetical protein
VDAAGVSNTAPTACHRDRMGLAHIAAANDSDHRSSVIFGPILKFGLQPVANFVSLESKFRKRHFENRKKRAGMPGFAPGFATSRMQVSACEAEKNMTKSACARQCG